MGNKLPIEGHWVGLGRTENGYCPALANAVVTEAVLFVYTWCHAAHGLYKFIDGKDQKDKYLPG